MFRLGGDAFPLNDVTQTGQGDLIVIGRNGCGLCLVSSALSRRHLL